MVENLSKIGMCIFYGDVIWFDFFYSVGFQDVDLFIVVFDDCDKQLMVVEYVVWIYLNVKILVCVCDWYYVYELELVGVYYVEWEVFEGVMIIGCKVLMDFGMYLYCVCSKFWDFCCYDCDMLDDLWENYNDGGVDKFYIDVM